MAGEFSGLGLRGRNKVARKIQGILVKKLHLFPAKLIEVSYSFSTISRSSVMTCGGSGFVLPYV
jgi:hypothetical protein